MLTIGTINFAFGLSKWADIMSTVLGNVNIICNNLQCIIISAISFDTMLKSYYEGDKIYS